MAIQFLNNPKVGDNVKIEIGASSDLQIYHDGSNSYIDETGTGALYIQSNIVNLRSSTGEWFMEGIADGAVNLYHNNVKKFETTSAGVTVTGTITSSSASPSFNLTDTDNSSNISFSSIGGALVVNSTSDQVYEIGGTEKFRIGSSTATFAGKVSVGGGDTSTAQMALKGQQSLLSFIRGTAGDAQFFMSSDSSRLYFSHTDTQTSNLILKLDASNESATFAGNITFGDSHFIGDDDDDNLLIQSSANENVIINSADDLFFRTSGTTQLQISSSSATFAGGVKIAKASANLDLAQADGGSHFRIELDSADDTYISTIGGNPMYLRTNQTTALTLDASQNATFAGAITLSGKVSGVTAGTANTDAVNFQQLTDAVTGVLVYQGVWDASGTGGGSPDLTAGDRKVPGYYWIVNVDGQAAPNGTGTTPNEWVTGDWCVFSDQDTDAWQKIDNTNILTGAGTGGTVSGWAGSGTSVTLGNTPLTFAGTVLTTGGDINIGNSASLYLGDSSSATTGKAVFGAGSDLELYSNGTDGYVVAPVDDLVLQAADDVFIYTQGGEDAIIAKGNAAVEIYHNNAKKFETTSTGVSVTGGIVFGDNHFIGNGSGDNLSIQSSTGEAIVLDSSSDIVLDAGGNDISLQAAGTEFGKLSKGGGSDFVINSSINDKDIIFTGLDGGSAITALTLDMSDSGAAEFGARVYIPEYIAHVGDSNSLFGFSGNDTFIVKTSGSERMRIDSAGNVGIGTDSPNSFSGQRSLTINGTDNSRLDLQVAGSNKGEVSTSAGALFLIHNTGDIRFQPGGTFKMIVKSSGNVGIGTTGPQELLHVKASNTTATVEIQGGLDTITAIDQVQAEINFGANDTSATGGIAGSIKSITEVSNGAHNGIAFYTGRQSRNPYLQRAMQIRSTGGISFGSGSASHGSSGQILKSNGDASPTWVNPSTVIGGPYLPLSGGTMASGAAITFTVPSAGGSFINVNHTGNEAWTIAAQSGVGADDYLDIGISGGNRAMSWHETGRVGIGTNAPSSLLHLSSASSPTLRIVDTTNGVTLLAFSQDSNAHVGTFSNTDLIFDTNSNERMRILNGGNVGIGTTSPSVKFQVAGSSKLGGPVYVSSDGNFNTSATYTFRDAVFINNPNDTSATSSSNSVMSIGGMSGNSVKTSLITTGAIGIGTASPLAKLHLSDTTGGTIYIEDSDGTATHNVTSISNSGNNLTLDTRRSTGTFVSTDYQIAKNASGADYHRWFTQGSERIRLNSAGRLGIGTTSPQGKVHISDTSTQLVLETPNATNDIDFRFRENGSNKWNFRYQNSSNALELINQTGSTTLIQLSLKADGSSLFGGNVGIGSFPTSRLQIEQSILPRITMIKTGVLSWYVGNPTQGSSGNFTIGTDSGSNLDILTLDTSGNSTFSGNVDVEINTSGNNVISTFKNENTTAGNRSAIKVEQQVNATGSFSAFLGSTIDGKVFLSNDSITANHLLIDTSGNSTFAGAVKINTTVSALGKLAVRSTSGAGTFYNNIQCVPSDATTGGLFIGSNVANDAIMVTGAYYSNAGAYIPTATSASIINMFNGNVAFRANGSLTVGTEYTPTERMRITSSGDVGIGTNNPAAKLQVDFASYANSNAVANFINGNNPVRVAYDTVVIAQTDVASLSIVETPDGLQANEQKLTFAVGDNASIIRTANTSSGLYINVNAPTDKAAYLTGQGTIAMRFLNNGNVIVPTTNVGIGTTSPSAKLHVDDSFGGAAIKVAGLITDSSAHYYGFMHDATDLQGTTQVNTFYSGGAIKASTTIADYAGIRIDTPNVSADGAAVTNNYGIYQSSSLQKNYFAGNIGIGIISPGAKLDVRGSGGGYLKFDTSNSTGSIKSDFNLQLYADPEDGNTSGLQNIQFFTAGTSEKVRIDYSGRVGIGTTNPAHKLEVSGGGISIKGNLPGNSLRFDSIVSGTATSRNALFVDSTNVFKIGNTNYTSNDIIGPTKTDNLHVDGTLRVDALSGNAPSTDGYQEPSETIIGGSGSASGMLGDPGAWLDINVDGSSYYIPLYSAG